MGQVPSSESTAGGVLPQEESTVRVSQKRACSPDTFYDTEVEFESTKQLIARAAKWGYHYKKRKTEACAYQETSSGDEDPAIALPVAGISEHPIDAVIPAPQPEEEEAETEVAGYLDTPRDDEHSAVALPGTDGHVHPIDAIISTQRLESKTTEAKVGHRYHDDQLEEYSGGPAEHLSLWSMLLYGSPMLNILTSTLQAPPTPNQEKIIRKLLEGTSVIAHGSYGRDEHLAVRLAVLSAFHRAKQQPMLNITFPNRAHPTVIYVAGTTSQCEAFAIELRKLDRLPHVAVISGETPLHTRQRPDRSCDILCATPGSLVYYVKERFVTLCQTRLLVLDEANTMLGVTAWNHITQISRSLQKQQGSVPAPNLFIGSSFDKAQMDKFISNRNVVASGGEAVVLEMRTESCPPPSMDLSFAVGNAVERAKQFQLFLSRSLQADRAILVFTPNKDDVDMLENVLRSCPYVRVRRVEQDTTQELQPVAAAWLTTSMINVLLIRIGEDNSGIFAPSLRGYPGELSVCVFKIHKEHGGRSWFAKYHDLVSRMGCIEQVKECFTLISHEEHIKAGHSNKIRKWLESIGREVPACIRANVSNHAAGRAMVETLVANY